MPSFSQYRSEQRQHINLSQYAYDVILNDSLTLMGQKNISGFINLILSNCEETYYTDKSLNTRAPYPKDITLKVRLRNDIYDEYYPVTGEWAGARLNISQGELIKAIIEDYSRLPFFDRESIFYKRIIESINNHISLPDNKGILPIHMIDGRKFYIKPYRISSDYEAPFHYLICLSSIEHNGDYRPASIRISRITKIDNQVTSYGTGIIKIKERKELERRIKENGVPYIIGDLQEFKIRLTPQGLDMYNTIFHQRPMYDTITRDNNSFILVFHSTERQIENYFFPFAKEALILSPESTQNWMSTRYKEACESYNNSLGRV